MYVYNISLSKVISLIFIFYSFMITRQEHHQRKLISQNSGISEDLLVTKTVDLYFIIISMVKLF
jgi:deferrochelatase/peroxidase EfeB